MYIAVPLTLPESKFRLLYIAIALTLPERKFRLLYIAVALTLHQNSEFDHITLGFFTFTSTSMSTPTSTA